MNEDFSLLSLLRTKKESYGEQTHTSYLDDTGWETVGHLRRRDPPPVSPPGPFRGPWVERTPVGVGL